MQIKSKSRKQFGGLLQQNSHEKVSPLFANSKQKLTNSINEGTVKINNKSEQLQKKIKDIDEVVKVKKSILSLQLNNLGNQCGKDSQRYQSLKREIINKKKQQIQFTKEEEAKRKIIYEQKAKKWIQQQKLLKIKKEIHENKKRQFQKLNEQKVKQEAQESERLYKQQKIKAIENNLKIISKQKRDRQDVIKKGIQLLKSQSEPLYVKIQRQYHKKKLQHNFEIQRAIKSKQFQDHIDHEAIKQHEKIYLQKVKIRTKSQQKLRASKDQAKGQFSILFKRNDDEVNKQMQRLKRRKQFQNKIKQIPIQIDQAKRVEIDIAKDRGKNSMKYNFLAQKSLSQSQIYRQFKQFQINTNQRELGKGYLQDLRKLPKLSRIHQQKSIKSEQRQSEALKYPNYLIQLKQSRPQRIHNQEEISQIVRKYESHNQAKSLLIKKSQEYEADFCKKVDSLRNMKNYKQSLKQSSQVDNTLMKIMKTKLAYLQIGQ